MLKDEVILNTKVVAGRVTCSKYIGTIVSEEILFVEGGGKYQVLVQFDKETSPRYVAGGRLVKIDF